MANEQTYIVASFAISKYSLEQDRPDIASNQDLTFNLRDHMSLATVIACSNEENREAIAISLANVEPSLSMQVFHYEDDGRGRIKRRIVQRIGRSWRNARNYLFHKEKCRKNAINRSKQLYTHTRGSKTMARKRHEEEQRQGRPIGRGEIWTMSHKKKRMVRI
ncbi:hypothetical protein Ahy_B04g071421 isoform A [Arachis hypogaea]|uniref:Uncharacterized protein n=1 Tax=Arachis hypogaea TaxID=3818 RepID=A0A444ZKP7_ARAHY|nr:hypothetical protein Ahy_B04g071421 isoform A [Arachis hypogaea]